MARKKNVETDILLSLIDEFFALKCDRDTSLLKIPAIGDYIRSKGYDLKDYTLRRDEVVRKHIEKLRITSEEAHINTVSVYRDIDIDAFLRKNNTENKIKKALIEREKYYREITNSVAYSFKENKNLKQINEELKEQNRKLQLELDKEKDTTLNTISDNKMLAKENKILREIIDTYVYPEIANELLKKSGLIHETAGVVDEKSLDNEIITSDTDVSKIKNKVVQGLFDRL